MTVTLRSRRPGETVVPAGCGTVPYDERLAAAAEADAVVSATRSPHYTFTAEMVRGLPPRPRQIVDLAVPRDVEPAVAELPGVVYENIDTIGDLGPALSPEKRRQIDALFDKSLRDFADWSDGRMLRDTARLLKENIGARVAASLESGEGEDDPVAFAVGRAVDILLFSMKKEMTPALVQALRQAARGCPARRRV